MLLRLECVIALFADDVMLDIAARIGAVRHVVERRVRNLRQLLVELGGERFLLLFHRRQRCLELGHFGHQLVGPGLVLGLFGVADFLGRRIAARLCLLEFGDGRPPLFVERHQLFRQRLQPAPLQAAVEGVGMLANPFDVVHGGRLLIPSWPGLSRPSRSGAQSVAYLSVDARHKAGHDSVNNCCKYYSAGFAVAEAARPPLLLRPRPAPFSPPCAPTRSSPRRA